MNIGSLGAKNLFTNVTVQETIKIIIENVYDHLFIPPLAIKPNILENLLRASITLVLFNDPSGKYTLKQTVLVWVLHLDPLYLNLHIPHRKQNI